MASPTPSSDIRIGISGWTYPGWRGSFYPPGLPQRAEMEYAASRFPSIEVNGTFYSLQRAAYFRSWRDRAPDDFLFALKGSRFITHMKQLNDPEQPLANFFAQGVLELGDKLGPILWQFSPRFRFRPEKLAPFLALLPRTHAAAADLAADHDHRVKDPATEALTPDRPLRHAIEVRHGSFHDDDFTALLREHDAALVASATAGEYPFFDTPTAPFTDARLHGSEAMYAGSYTDPELDHWADRVRHWSTTGDVFLYFDNDQKTHAPFDARRLMDRLALAQDLPLPGTDTPAP